MIGTSTSTLPQIKVGRQIFKLNSKSLLDSD